MMIPFVVSLIFSLGTSLSFALLGVFSSLNKLTAMEAKLELLQRTSTENATALIVMTAKNADVAEKTAIIASNTQNQSLGVIFGVVVVVVLLVTCVWYLNIGFLPTLKAAAAESVVNGTRDVVSRIDQDAAVANSIIKLLETQQIDLTKQIGEMAVKILELQTSLSATESMVRNLCIHIMPSSAPVISGIQAAQLGVVNSAPIVQLAAAAVGLS